MCLHEIRFHWRHSLFARRNLQCWRGRDVAFADRLIARGFAKLYGDGKPQKIDGKIPQTQDWWSNSQLAEHLAKLKKDGWTPPPPIVLKDEDVAREARERARQEMNQV